jgi:hypothetical protein
VKRILWILSSFAAVLLTITMVSAADNVVETIGISSISRSDAIRQAQRAAVEQSVGVFVHSETEVSNFILKRDEILTRTQGYVTRFRVLNEETKGDYFTASIRATVSLDKIKNDLIALKILLDSLERPTLMVLIDEDYTNISTPQMQIAETELNAQLTERGFELLDKTQLENVAAQNERRQALAGNVSAASRLGLMIGAQYVIFGKGVAHNTGEVVKGTGIQSVQSSVQLKVVQSQSGLLLGSVVENGAAAHINPITGAVRSLKEAVNKALDNYLVDAITTSFQDHLNNGAPLKLNITGVTSFRHYKRIASVVESIEKVVSSKKEGWNKNSGLLTVDLRFRGTSEELAVLLDGRNLEGNNLEVVDFAPDRVDCQLK